MNRTDCFAQKKNKNINKKDWKHHHQIKSNQFQFQSKFVSFDESLSPPSQSQLQSQLQSQQSVSYYHSIDKSWREVDRF